MDPLKNYPIPASLSELLDLLAQESSGVITTASYQIFWFRASEGWVLIHALFGGTTILCSDNSFFFDLETETAFSFVAQTDECPRLCESTALFESFLGSLIEA